MKIVWFRHSDEHRNDLLRFGLMRLHACKEIHYSERKFPECRDFGFPEQVAAKIPHHASVIMLLDGSRRIRCVVDSEDSFYWLSPLISDCDRFFCSGYNDAFFKGKSFAGKYEWQREDEISWYRSRSDELIQTYGEHFGNVRPFVPIGPSLGYAQSRSRIGQKFANLTYRVRSKMSDGLLWDSDLENYERRYSRLMSLRERPLQHDVTLFDTLWGWPRHRVALHRQLAELSGRRDIHSRLSWAVPVPFDGSEASPENETKFPMVTSAIGNYEDMLASSRLGVFATGFHWGWRSIMSLALLFGIPVLMDRPLLRPWFDLADLGVEYNDSPRWEGIEALLDSISDRDWMKRKSRNITAYDHVMSPEAVARYFIGAAAT